VLKSRKHEVDDQPPAQLPCQSRCILHLSPICTIIQAKKRNPLVDHVVGTSSQRAATIGPNCIVAYVNRIYFARTTAFRPSAVVSPSADHAGVSSRVCAILSPEPSPHNAADVRTQKRNATALDWAVAWELNRGCCPTSQIHCTPESLVVEQSHHDNYALHVVIG
jgi:hypothetical protein